MFVIIVIRRTLLLCVLFPLSAIAQQRWTFLTPGDSVLPLIQYYFPGHQIDTTDIFGRSRNYVVHDTLTLGRFGKREITIAFPIELGCLYWGRINTSVKDLYTSLDTITRNEADSITAGLAPALQHYISRFADDTLNQGLRCHTLFVTYPAIQTTEYCDDRGHWHRRWYLDYNSILTGSAGPKGVEERRTAPRYPID